MPGKGVSVIPGCEKSVGIPTTGVRWRVARISNILLKGLCTQTHAFAGTLSSREGTVTQEAPETYRARLSRVASHQELDGQPPFLPCSLWAGALFPVLSPPPTRPNLKLHCPGKFCLCHPDDSLGPHPAQLENHWRHFRWPGNQPHPMYLRRLLKQQTPGLGSCITGGTFDDG